MSITPIGQLDYRLPQAGRIRIGEKVWSPKKRRWFPTTLDFFRLTSGDRELIEWVAERYGGTVEKFEAQGSGDKWKVDLPKDVKLDVQVPVPGCITLSYELWDPHLVRRCNGTTCEVLEDTPDDARIVERDCLCARRGVLECDMKLRLSVLLPDLPTLGTWRFDTESDNAIKEIRGTVQALGEWAGRGLHRCTMRITERRKPSERGKPGKVFKVVVLDPGISIESLVAGDARLVQLPTPSSPAVGALGAGASSVTQPASTPEAGEPMTGEVREDARTAVDSSLASPPTCEHTGQVGEVCPWCGEIIEDDIVDAELVSDDIERWKQQLSTKQQAIVLVAARRLAPGMGEPVPTTFDSITDRLIEQLMGEAGDDARVRTQSD